MATVFEVPATELIEEIAKDLEKNPNTKMPQWAKFVKTGAHKERAPHDQNWYYFRLASILRKIYLNGPIGTERLRTYYGGKKWRGLKPRRFRKGGGKIVRTCLQQLEKDGLIKKEKKGRVITPKGTKYLNLKAKEVSKILKEKVKTEKVLEMPRMDERKSAEKFREEKKAAEQGKEKKAEKK